MPGPLLALLLVVPAVIVNPWTWDIYGVPKDVAVQVLIVALLLATIVRHPEPRIGVPATPLSLPLAGLLVLGGISAARSIDPIYALLELGQLALLVVLFHLLAGAPERTGLVYRTMAAVGGVTAVYAVLQLVGLDLVHTVQRFQPYAFFGNRNPAAEFLSLALPPALALLLLARTRRGLALWTFVAGLAVVHLAAAQTRAVWVGLSVGGLPALALWRASAPGTTGAWPSRRRWALAGGILALGYALFFFPQPFRALRPVTESVLLAQGWRGPGIEGVAAGAFPGKELRAATGLGSRLLFWRAGLRMVADHPWTGVGPGNVGLVYSPTYHPIEYWWPEWEGEHFLHNDLLQVAAELGIPAVALILWILAALGVMLWRARAASRPVAGQIQLVAALWALSAFSVASLFGFPWHLPAQRLYAVVLGACLLALASPGRARSFSVSRPVALAVAGLFGLIVLLGPVRLQVAEMYATAAWEAWNQGARARALALHQSARAWFRPMVERNALWGRVVDPRPQYEKAVRHFRAQVAERPWDDAALANLGLALQRAGGLEEAQGVVERLLERKPGDPGILRRAFDLALERERPDEAYRVYVRLFQRVGCDAQISFNLGVAYYRAGRRDVAEQFWAQAVACDPRLSGMREAWLRRFDPERLR